MATDTAFRFLNIKPEIGAGIYADKGTLLGGEYAEQIRKLLEEKGVPLFSQIHFSDEEHVAFTKTLGSCAPEMHGSETYNVTLCYDSSAHLVSGRMKSGLGIDRNVGHELKSREWARSHPITAPKTVTKKTKGVEEH
jgi:hypothetical protein